MREWVRGRKKDTTTDRARREGHICSQRERGEDRKQSEWMRGNASTDGMEMKITG